MYIPDNCQFTRFLIFVFRTNRGIRIIDAEPISASKRIEGTYNEGKVVMK
jgi:hypothetical protein